MKTSEASGIPEERKRLPYEAPALTSYNQAEVTMGGAVGPRPLDQVNHLGGTSYKIL